MNRETALQELKSNSNSIRLDAARALKNKSRKEDLPEIILAYSRETVPWIKAALRSAIKQVSGEIETAVEQMAAKSEDEEQLFVDEIKNEALRATTKTITHELEPVLGRIIYFAKQELKEYEKSKTKREIERLEGLFNGIKELGNVTGRPNLRQFDLTEIIHEIVGSEGARIQPKVFIDSAEQSAGGEKDKNEIRIVIARTEPLLVVADQYFIEIAFSNGLRNALEATMEIQNSDLEGIVINFGKTGTKYYWLTILDRGKGLEVSGKGLFQMGNSTKNNHDGMGLPLAGRAMQSLGGNVDLYPREGGGVRFEMKWPVEVGEGNEVTGSGRQAR